MSNLDFFQKRLWILSKMKNQLFQNAGQIFEIRFFKISQNQILSLQNKTISLNFVETQHFSGFSTQKYDQYPRVYLRKIQKKLFSESTWSIVLESKISDSDLQSWQDLFDIFHSLIFFERKNVSSFQRETIKSCFYKNDFLADDSSEVLLQQCHHFENRS
jgi:hypothetical protein